MKKYTLKLLSALLMAVIVFSSVSALTFAQSKTEETTALPQNSSVFADIKTKDNTPLTDVSDNGGIILSGQTKTETVVASADQNEGGVVATSSKYESIITPELYKKVKTQLKKIADGETASTEFTITYKDMFGTAFWTAEDLGIGNNYPSIKAKAEAMQIAGFEKLDTLSVFDDFYSLFFSLLADCPYELYWFNKVSKGSFKGGCPYTEGVEYEIQGTTKEDLRFIFEYSYCFVFSVSEPYWDGTTYSPITFDDGSVVNYASGIKHNQTLSTVKKAKNTAAAIVEKYKDKSDSEKLAAYESEICALSEYNHAAAEDESHYGQAHQLVWLFDKDPDTKVVCEGFAKGFKYLCDLTTFKNKTIKCDLVWGNMYQTYGQSGSHMWNVVRIDGKNYMVDVTNDRDATSGKPRHELFLVAPKSGSADMSTGYTFIRSGTNITYKYDTMVVISPSEVYQEMSLIYSENDLELSKKSYSTIHIYDGDCDADCNYCGAKRTPTGKHTFKTDEYKHDSQSHWQVCTVCGEICNKTSHNFGVDTECDVCGYDKGKVLRGDVNSDGFVTSDDAIYLLHYTFEPEDYPLNQGGDMNGDGPVTSDDAIYLLHYTFEPEDYPLKNQHF